MERDCMISHGAAEFLRERLFTVSDPFQISVCRKCGIMTATQKECQNCKSDNVVQCNMPYASKLMMTELAGIGLKLQLCPEEN